jgi:hypothetical protein
MTQRATWLCNDVKKRCHNPGTPPHDITWHMHGFATQIHGKIRCLHWLAGDVMGDHQLPQTLVWPTCILEPLYHTVKVLKLAQQATMLMDTNATTLGPVDANIPVQRNMMRLPHAMGCTYHTNTCPCCWKLALCQRQSYARLLWNPPAAKAKVTS